MADPIKLKRKVTAQIPLSTPSTAHTSTTSATGTVRSNPRPRAKVDLASIPSPTSTITINNSNNATPPSHPTRPTIRSTPSTQSLRSSYSSSTIHASTYTPPTRPPLPHLGSSTPKAGTTPVNHHRLVRAHSQTPPVTPSTPGSMGPPTTLRRGLTTPAPLKVRATPTTASYGSQPSSSTRSRTQQSSPEPPPPSMGHRMLSESSHDGAFSVRVRARSKGPHETLDTAWISGSPSPSMPLSSANARRSFDNGNSLLSSISTPSKPSRHELITSSLQQSSPLLSPTSLASTYPRSSSPQSLALTESPKPGSPELPQLPPLINTSPPIHHTRNEYPSSASTHGTPNVYSHFQNYTILNPTASCPSSPLPLSARFPGDNIPSTFDHRHVQLQNLTSAYSEKKGDVPRRSSTTDALSSFDVRLGVGPGTGERSRKKIPLPPNPHLPPPNLPLPPSSPELRTIALPAITPQRSRNGSEGNFNSPQSSELTTMNHNDSRRFSIGSDLSSNISSDRDRRMTETVLVQHNVFPVPSEISFVNGVNRSRAVDRDRLSGSTVVEDEGGGDSLKKLVEENDVERGERSPDDVEIVLGTDAEQAKINRKIADLEISNASLMAINRSLEATKEKQRIELLKLRRLVRTSLPGYTGLNILLSSSTSSSHGQLSNPNPNIHDFNHTKPLSPTSSDIPYFPNDSSGDIDAVETGDMEFDEEDIEDPELEERWDKISQVVLAMRNRGEDAVVKGRESVKAAGQRVLQWTQNEEVGLGVEGGQGEGGGEGGDADGEVSMSASLISSSGGGDGGFEMPTSVMISSMLESL